MPNNPWKNHLAIFKILGGVYCSSFCSTSPPSSEVYGDIIHYERLGTRVWAMTSEMSGIFCEVTHFVCNYNIQSLLMVAGQVQIIQCSRTPNYHIMPYVKMRMNLSAQQNTLNIFENIATPFFFHLIKKWNSQNQHFKWRNIVVHIPIKCPEIKKICDTVNPLWSEPWCSEHPFPSNSKCWHKMIKS